MERWWIVKQKIPAHSNLQCPVRKIRQNISRCYRDRTFLESLNRIFSKNKYFLRNQYLNLNQLINQDKGGGIQKRDSQK